MGRDEGSSGQTTRSPGRTRRERGRAVPAVPADESSSPVPAEAPERRQALLRRGQQAVTALLAVLDRLVPMAARLVGAVRVLAWIGLVSAAVIVLASLVVAYPPSAATIVVLVVLAGLLAVPGGLLLLFHGALVEVLALPDWLRSSPEVVRTHGAEIARLAAVSSGTDRVGAPVSRRPRHFGRDLVQAARLVVQAHGDLPEYGRALRLVRPGFLVAVVVSLPVVLGEGLFALIMVLVAAGSLLVR